MKKTLLIALLISISVLLAISIGCAQTISFGPSGGLGHSYLTPYKQYEYKFTWNAGFSAMYSASDRWGIGMDVKYSSEGRMIAGVVRDLNYMRIPLRAIYFMGQPGDRLHPKITFGPAVGFLLTSAYVRGYEPNKMDLGINASLGFNYKVRDDLWFNLDLRSYQGLTDVYTRAGSDVSTKEFNGNVCLDTGLLFGF
jgi:outer membrane protein W